MDVTAQVDMTFLRCRHGANCDCDSEEICPVTIHGTVFEFSDGYDTEVTAVDGLPEGMALSDLDPRQLEVFHVELERVAEARSEAQLTLLGATERAARQIRSGIATAAGIRHYPERCGSLEATLRIALIQLDVAAKAVRS